MLTLGRSRVAPAFIPEVFKMKSESVAGGLMRTPKFN
jgi:hypothetical protein